MTPTSISTNNSNAQLLLSIFKRRGRIWMVMIALIFTVILLGLMILMPLNYFSETTISVQQPSSSSASPLALLTGQSQAKKYLGILKSRRLAEQVEGYVNLQDLYSLPTKAKAVEKLMKCLKVEESLTDGLVSIQITLPGSPRLRAHGKLKREIVAQKAADAANYFYSALKDYYINTDNERDTVLLRAAERESRKAAGAFDAAAENLKQFVRDLRKYSPRSAPSSSSTAESQSVAANELLTLYTSLSKVDADVKSAEAGMDTQGRLTGEQLNNLQILPSEDPLLSESRNDVKQAKTRLDSLRIQLADDSPQVLLARKRYELAQKNLVTQAAGVREKKTSDQVITNTSLDRVKARREVILSQIQQAEGRLPLKRMLASDFEQLKNELVIRLEVRKTTETEFAKLRLSTVSAQSRLSVVDVAIPAEGGKPGIMLLAAASLIGALTCVLAALSLEYSSLLRKRNEATA